MEFAGDWRELLDPETWWALDPCAEDGQEDKNTFDGEELDACVAWASACASVRVSEQARE